MKTRVTWIVLGLLAACGTPSENNTQPENNTNNGKGDIPTDDPNYNTEQTCADRKDDVLNAGRTLFTRDFIRWSCADVAGVNTNNQDDRGQEYCEYFGILQLPPEEEGGEFGETVTLGRNTDNKGGTTDLGLDLTEDQIFYLEDHSSEVLGQCVFTTWHNDVNTELPACETECPTIEGMPVDADTFQMKVFFNSNGAANSLVRDCASNAISGDYEKGDASDEDDPYHSDFFRGCVLTDNVGAYSFRKSDSSVCAASLRLAECGCIDDAKGLADAVVPALDAEPLRGFPLGGWAGPQELPTGCSYVTLGDESRTLVTCNVTGGDIITNRTDLKGFCRNRYGDNVVVHVPLPADAIECSPGDGQYADTCTDEPWVVTE